MYQQFEGRKVAILGLGTEGISSLRFFSKQGAEVFVRDRNQKEEIDQDILAEAQTLTNNFIFGPTYLQNLLIYDYVVRTPSIRPDCPELLEAQHTGVKVTSNLRTFFDLCPGKIIGVTGTKGKGTTTALIGEMLKKSGHRTFVGGNIGEPPLNFLNEVGSDNWVVLEMSSFQLMDMEKSPHIAVVLMITSEHLDWHKDNEEYIEAKEKIVVNQRPEDFAVINVDYPSSARFAEKTPAAKIFVSTKSEQKQGVFVKNKSIARDLGKGLEYILPTQDIYLRGKHNIENIVAAAATASIIGASAKDISEVGKEFKGLPHRLEFVREFAGVKYYNDSFSTTPETAIAAIQSFTEPLILVLGGSEKGSSYSQLGEEVNKVENIRNIILIGDTAKKIEGVIDSSGKYKDRIIRGLSNMSDIVSTASSKASSGDVVLLSPACASFGLFRNYKERGELFKKDVMSLSQGPS